MRVAVLLSAGRSPVSGRARRAPHDARALELALRLSPTEMAALHVGDPDDASLSEYLGMGLEEIEVVRAPPGCDAYPALVRWTQAKRPDVLVCGAVAVDRDGEGLVPYLLAEDLERPILNMARSLAVSGPDAIIERISSHGRAFTLAARLPVVVSTDMSAPKPRQSAYGRARRGRVRCVEEADWLRETVSPWRVRPTRRQSGTFRSVDASASAEDRLRAVTETAKCCAGPAVGLDAEAAASRILAYLRQEGILLPPEEGERP